MSPRRSVPADPGSYIPNFVECSRVYDDIGAGFALFVERHGLPTGRVIPKQAIDLIEQAHALRPAFVPFGAPLSASDDAQAACKVRQAELADQARAILAQTDMALAA